FLDRRSAKLFLKKKIQKGYYEYDTDNPTYKSMEPLPEINALKILQRKMGVQFLVLGILLILVERGFPFRLVHRGQGVTDQFKISHGQAGFGQPGNPPYDHHYKY